MNYCWAIGYEQTWLQDHFLSEWPEERNFGRPEPGELRTHLWLMASSSYSHALERFFMTLEAASDPVRVCIRWVPDMKVVEKKGFILNLDQPKGRHVFLFNYRKILLLFEALLVASVERHGPSPMVVVMDLDVQVFSGWTHTLRVCVDGNGAADVCFFQQPGFVDERIQQANSGVVVFRGQSAVGALLSAQVARLQAFDSVTQIFPHSSYDGLEYEQLSLNYILTRIRLEVSRAQASTGATQAVKFGLYNPLLAHVGMFLTHAVLSVTLHHATSSDASLRDKLRLMDAEKDFVSDLREHCPEFGSHGNLRALGPAFEFCYLYLAEDPHFGPLLDHFRVYRGFGESDNLVVSDHVLTKLRGRNLWVQMITAFNVGGWRYWKAKRRNSSRYMTDMLWYSSFQKKVVAEIL